MTRALLYARYSTALQSEASVDDQFRLLRQWAAREGFTIVGEQADRAISGTVRDRPGLLACLAAVESGAADLVLAESLDRLSRDQEDLAGLYKRVRFHGARIVTLSEGEIGAMHIGLGGTLSAMFLEQLAEKTRRGQIGRVEAGRIPGGLSYGYRAVRRLAANGEPERGLREIDADQAAIVVGIFTAYADGDSAVAIARRLNEAGTPAPRGGLWRANAISGHRQRRNGVLNNELYRGRILYNRQSFRKDPETRRRVSRLNEAEALVAHDVPALRIVTEDLWDRVQARLASYAGRPAHQARRPRRLLSGLLKCGHCGGSFTVVSGERWGCATRQQTGACDNGRTIVNRQAEARVWAAVQHHLLHPDVVAAYLDEMRLAAAEARRSHIADSAAIDRRLAELDREDERLVAAIASGVPLEGLTRRAEAIAAERSRLRTERAPAAEQVAALIHPGIAEAYRRKVEQLHALCATMTADAAATQHGRAILAALIDRIDVTPRADGRRGTDLTLHGDLAGLLTLKQQKAPGDKPGAFECTVKLVAGVGFEPTTFRL